MATTLGGVHLGLHAVDHPVHQAGVAVDEPRLEVRDGVPADRVLGPDELHAEEPRRPAQQGVEPSRRDAGRDRAPDELAARVDAVERGGRAEVDEISGAPYSAIAATALTIRSAPTSRGWSTASAIGVLTPGRRTD